MPKVKVVTGYVPIPDHPRSAAAYGRLGEECFGNLGDVPVRSYYWPVERCWMYRFLQHAPYRLTHSVSDNPAKNTVMYHCVNHQKFEWLHHDAMLDPEPDVFVWIDYGILHVPGITVAVIRDMLKKVVDNDLAIPGCVPKPLTVDDQHPCWRFCGGLLVVPRTQVSKFYETVRDNAVAHIKKTRNVSWEVNTLARVEKGNTIKIRWYQADHNETMFTGYANDVSAIQAA